MILCGWFLSSRLGIPIMSLAIGVLIGGVLQLLMQYPILRHMGIRLRLDFNFRDAAVMKIARLMLPGIAGVAIYQINVVVTRLLASFLPEGSVSYLYYGQRLFEFPQGIFIVSLAQAVLPSMSRQASRDDMEGLRSSLRFALSLILLVTLPAMIGLVLCATPIYSLFFMGGAFGAEEVEKTAMALAAYAPGLLFVGISRVVVPTFYALKNTRTPVWIAFWTLLVNGLLGILLMGPLAHLGLAMALTLSSVFNSIALVWALRSKIGPLGLAALLSSLFKLVPAAVLMALFVQGTLSLIEWDLEGHKFLKGMVLGGAVLGGGGIYALVCWLLRVPEATEAAALFRKKLFRRRE
jgi:putative peptidoglycan lipid II flippase